MAMAALPVQTSILHSCTPGRASNLRSGTLLLRGSSGDLFSQLSKRTFSNLLVLSGECGNDPWVPLKGNHQLDGL